MVRLLACLALVAVVGCSQAPRPCDGPSQDDATAQSWQDLNTRAHAMRDSCTWHSPEAHANARRLGYTLECDTTRTRKD